MIYLTFLSIGVSFFIMVVGLIGLMKSFEQLPWIVRMGCGLATVSAGLHLLFTVTTLVSKDFMPEALINRNTEVTELSMYIAVFITMTGLLMRKPGAKKLELN